MAARGQYAKGVAKREEILRTALDVIARNGYRGTSVRELADAVGLSQAGLLHYFSSKEELFEEVLRLRDTVDGERFVAGEVDPLDAFISVIAHNSDVPGLVQLYSQLSAAAGDPDHPSRAYFVERFDAFRDLVGSLIHEQQSKGVIRSDVDARTIANLLLAAADGLQTQWLLDPSIDMAAELSQLVRLLSPANGD
jgi:AcrR family transcriptional regulator